MSAKKVAPAPVAGIATKLTSAVGQSRWIFVAAIVLGGLGVGWQLSWKHVREHVLSDRDYQLDPSTIAITPQPAWIHADVKAEVIRDASLESSLSILDEDLTVRVANAFSLHPWIAKVQRVSKHHPASVNVEVTYREPAAMVEVSGGLLPVDGDGTLLPSEDFSTAEAKKYPRIARINSHPAGPVGTNWGDVQVTGGAMIAKALGERWQLFKLYRVLAPVRDSDVDGYTYELLTHAGTRVLWGRPPGSEPNGEAAALEKIVQLEKIVAENGTLEGPAGSQEIDLRRRGPRTAIKKLPKSAAN